ncbi:MAG TPA: hypothetical protein VKF81_11570 [Blastocatellia bacterium]|nr:hypothetical protein [Blastocatellia bacterium]
MAALFAHRVPSGERGGRGGPPQHLNAISTVVLVSVDFAAFALQLAVKPDALAVAQVAIHLRVPLIRFDLRGPLFKPVGFTPRQLDCLINHGDLNAGRALPYPGNMPAPPVEASD